MNASALWSHVVCALLTTIVLSTSVSAGTLFRDDFADGDAEDGSPASWTPEPLSPGAYDATTGDYLLSNGAVMVATVPSHNLTDTSVRARARLVGGGIPDNFVGVAARRGSVFGYAAGLSRTGAIDIIRVDPDFQPTPLAAAVVPFNPVDQDVFLQLDVIGEELRFWVWPAGQSMPSAPQLIASDAAYASGAAGVAALVAPSAQAAYRFVEVADSHIPEPSTLALVCLAVVCLAGAVSRRKGRCDLSSGMRLCSPAKVNGPAGG